MAAYVLFVRTDNNSRLWYSLKTAVPPMIGRKIMEKDSEKLREKILSMPVADIHLVEIADFSSKYIDNLRKMGGFTARYLVRSADILVEMLSRDALIVMSFPANLVATGMRGILSDAIKYGIVDAVITTGGTFDHDIARGLGKKYYIGDFELDDTMLKELEIHRLGNILIPYENYGPPIEEFTHKMLEEMTAEEKAPYRFPPTLLAKNAGIRIKDENSILSAAAGREVPVFSPGIIDGAFGTAIYTFNETLRSSRNPEEVIVDVVADMQRISDLFFEKEKVGGILLGGGISKHHLIWWAQFRGGLDYAVAYTTAPEWDGSLSGARTREAITWGKIKPQAAHVTVPGDLTVTFPYVLAYAARETGYIG